FSSMLTLRSTALSAWLIAVACAGPTAPTGTNSIALVDVNYPTDTARPYGTFVIASIKFSVTSGLLKPSRLPGTDITIPVSYLMYVCLSVDGSRFANDCVAASGTQGQTLEVGLPSPTRASGITETN